MIDRLVERHVKKVRWLVRLAEGELARRHDRLPFKCDGLTVGSATVEELVAALVHWPTLGASPGDVAPEPAKQASIRAAYLARAAEIRALTHEEPDPDDIYGLIDQIVFKRRAEGKGRTQRLLVHAALAARRARRQLALASEEIEAAHDGTADRWRYWDPYVDDEPREVSLDDAEEAVSAVAHAAWLSRDPDVGLDF